MPSLYGTTVTANYGKMTAQQTYGTDNNFSNFGTRNLRFLAVFVTTDGSAKIDMTSTSVSTITGFTDFAAAVRTIQTIGEIYLVGAPGTNGFIVAVSGDTLADGTSVASSSPSYTAIQNALVATAKGQVASGRGSATASVTLMTVGGSSGSGLTIS
jgi:hypothetical protein